MEMKHTLEKQPNLYLKQAEIVDIGVEGGKVKSVETNIGAVYQVDNVILATGTYLKGKYILEKYLMKADRMEYFQLIDYQIC